MAKILNLLPWRRRRLEQDLERELRYHIDQRVEDLEQSGASEADARRRAALELGGIVQVQEEVRDAWVWRWLDDLSRDIRYGVRMLMRSPSFAATAMLSLALGIGANTALFSLVDQVLLRQLAVNDPGRLVYLNWRGNTLASNWGMASLISYPLCRDLQAQTQFFDGVFCRHPTEVSLSTGQQHAPVRAEIVSGSYFSVLGVSPALGRLIGPSDDLQPGAHPVVVLSHEYWKAHLGSAHDVVGRKVLVDNYPMTVIGIAPPDFPGVDPHARPALWVPATMTQQAANIDSYWDRLLDRRAFWMHAFGRLKPGVTVEEAKAGLQPWFQSMLEADTRREGFPSVTAEQRRAFLASTIDMLPAARGLSGLSRALERPLWVLMVGTSLLLLLACLNVASLLLARGAARGRELTTRLALGASRHRIRSQLLVESLLVALGGGALGLVAAPAVAQALLSFLSQATDLSFHIDYRVFLFALLVSMMTAGLCGLAPASQAGRIPLIAALRARTAIASGGVRVRKALVVGQMAFALILLVGAGLFVQTLASLYTRGPGFVSSNLLMLSLNPASSGHSEPDAERIMRAVLERLRELPGVESATVANARVLDGGQAGGNLTIDFDGRIVTERAAFRMRVGPGFFSTLGTEVIAGRDFDEHDVRAPGSKPRPYRTVIVNESFARRYFKDRSPVGHRLGLGNRPDTVTDIEIIGVVRDFSRRTLRDDAVELFFLPFWDQSSADGTFYLRTRDSADATLGSIRAAVAQVDPALPVSLRTVDEQIDQSLRTERMLATLSSAFGAVALLLAVVGLYGVMSFIVTQRTQEIGVRLALGATRASAVWFIVRDALIMIGAGTAIALPSAWALRRLVEAELFGVGALDGPTIALASGLLALVALGAAMLPAWRAASINPTDALRFE